MCESGGIRRNLAGRQQAASVQRKDNTLLIERTRRCAQEARARYHATVEAKISRDLARFPWESVVNRVLQLGLATLSRRCQQLDAQPCSRRASEKQTNTVLRRMGVRTRTSMSQRVRMRCADFHSLQGAQQSEGARRRCWRRAEHLSLADGPPPASATTTQMHGGTVHGPTG